ncbi:hypothetical protein [Gryllotalpicola protaetiae]|uniref:Uncharacterized protein n=1 Tax=Gryllotalpicola protaetiae TaxID=2419771 RepID=A0A387BN65_9MICO|nr:hypothetical protein [Gryllotalpicola protaetiae]AYG02446.1 hypothetical protein D7I44_02105 [Gryllotalpicola protaetiae]
MGGDISHDIDLIIGSPEVREMVRAALSELSESSHLQGTKWRGEFEGVHVDVYIPHQSELGGKLRLRVEVLAIRRRASKMPARSSDSWREASTDKACSILAAATAGVADDLPGHVANAFELLGPR